MKLTANKLCYLLLLIANYSYAQKDSSLISFHFQATTVSQYHPPFHSPYEGNNSLVPDEKTASSLTNTLFLTLRPTKNMILILNPEIAGGTGLSDATGIAGFPNGEIFRVGNPKPTIYLARLIAEKVFPFKDPENEYVPDAGNVVRGFYPRNYFKLFAGRFCLADFFDANPYSHDPRSQFLNWSFMSGGAWDYAADTRGYTWGIGGEWKNKKWRAAIAITQEPKVANALEFDMNISKAFATQLEVTRYYALGENEGQLQATLFFNKAHMGNYVEALKSGTTADEITTTANYKNHKYGFIINAAQQINKHLGAYARLSWNDGQNETWAYTEIDRSINAGLQWSSNRTEQSNILGIGFVANGISKPHRNYLSAGGYGFIIGDGRLNYGHEAIAEIYYRFNFFGNHLQVSPDYQFVINPAYNKDRGPVHVFAIRTHIEF